MKLIILPVLWVVNGLILLLTTLGIGLEWVASRLIPFQKFLTKRLASSWP